MGWDVVMQVSFRIDAASYGAFLNYSQVVVRPDGWSGSVVVTCEEGEVSFMPYRDPETGKEDGKVWIAARTRFPNQRANDLLARIERCAHPG